MAGKKESGLDKLARLIKDEFDNVRKEMATKEDLKAFATKEDLKEFATKEDLKALATKEDVRAIVDVAVDSAKKELLDEIRPIARAVDKDAETIVAHGKRITRMEHHLTLK